jgi:hypothetical protein
MRARLVAPSESIPLPEPLKAEELSVLAKEGIELEDLNLVKVEGDHTLSFKGQRVAIYIRDHGLLREENSLPMFHVAFCSTLESMQKNKRLFRYTLTQQEDEYFMLNWIGEQTVSFSQRLDVCRACLSLLHWDDFDLIERTREEQFEVIFSFTLKAFFERYPKQLEQAKEQGKAEGYGKN